MPFPLRASHLRSAVTAFAVLLTILIVAAPPSHAAINNPLAHSGSYNGWGSDNMTLGASWPNTNIWYLTQTMATGTNTYQFRADAAFNKWGRSAGSAGTEVANLNTVYSTVWSTGDPGAYQTTYTTGKYYTFRFLDQNYATTNFIVMETDNSPRTISSVKSITDTTFDGPIQVTVTMSGAVSGSEKVLLVYTTDNWTSRKVSEGSLVSGSTYNCQLPGQKSGVTVKYYVVTTTVSAATFEGYTTDNQRNLVTLQGDNNGGSNYSYTVSYIRVAGEINSWSTTRDTCVKGDSWPNTNIWHRMVQITDANYDRFKWVRGTSTDDWGQQWVIGTDGVDGDAFATDAATAMTYATSGNRDEISLQSMNANYYYYFRLSEDVTKGAVLRTSAAPINISSVQDLDRVSAGLSPHIRITLSGAKSAEEKILLVYTANGWTSRSVVEAYVDPSSTTTYYARIPAQASGTTVQYYVVNTTVSASTFQGYSDDNTRNLMTITGANNAGSNYSYVVGNFPIITEVMPDPQDNAASDDELEYIELYNPTGSTIDLTGYSIRVGTTGAYQSNTLVTWNTGKDASGNLNDNDPTTNSLSLAAGQYAVIVDPEYGKTAGNAPYDFPSGCLILTLGTQNYFKSTNMAPGDMVSLSNGSNEVDSFAGTFAWTTNARYSYEKVSSGEGDTYANWRNTRYSAFWNGTANVNIGTPGGANSTPLAARDLYISEVSWNGTTNEWVELHNRSTTRGYVLGDSNTTPYRAIQLKQNSTSQWSAGNFQHTVIRPGDYFLVGDATTVADTTPDIVDAMTIDSNAGLIELFDLDGVVIDSIPSSIPSTNNGRTLQRASNTDPGYGFAPVSWKPGLRAYYDGTTSTWLGGTPGRAAESYTESTVGIYITEYMYNSTAANNYIELYNAQSDTVLLTGFTFFYNGSREVSAIAAGKYIHADSYFLIEANEAATTATADVIDAMSLQQGVDQGILYARDGIIEVDTMGNGANWYTATSGTAVEKEAADQAGDGSVPSSWGNSTGSIGGVTGTPRAVNVYGDNTGPVITVNRDSYTMKVVADSYGYLFDVDFADASSNLDSVWIQRVPPSDTMTIASSIGSASYTANWKISQAFLNALTTDVPNAVTVMGRDVRGNISSATIHIEPEVISVNGDTTEWQDDEILDQRKGNILRFAWDDTAMFISYGGPDGSPYEVGGPGADFFFYMQTSTVTALDSTTTTKDWASGGTHTLPFNANYCVVFEGDYTGNQEDDTAVQFLKFVNGSGWVNQENIDSAVYLARRNRSGSDSKSNEFRLSWSHLGGKPESIAMVFFHQYEGASNIYNALPPGNPSGGLTNLQLTDFYLIPILTDTFSPTSAERRSVSPATRRVDGETTEWAWNYLPSADDTSLIRDSEFIWRAKLDDNRTDFDAVTANFANNYDLRQFRVAGDTTKIYFLAVMEDIFDQNAPMIGIAIDTNLVASSGQIEIGGTSNTRTLDTASWEMNILASSARYGYWNRTFSSFQTDGQMSINTGTVDAIEMAMPWNRIFTVNSVGDSLPKRLRFTVITGRRGVTNTLDFEAGGDATSRSLDGVNLASRKTPTWLAEVTNPDTTVGYYFEVDFDSVGNVLANRIDRVVAPETYAALTTHNIQLKAVDFNGNTVTTGDARLGSAMVFTHNGRGNLTVPDSGTWSAGLRTIQLRYDAEETITITCTTVPYGRVGQWTVGFMLDTTVANAWYVNDGSTSGDSFTTAVGSDVNRGLARWYPKASLEQVIPFLTAGDTVYIDVGTYNPAATLTIPIGTVLIMGADSRTTIIDWNDSSGGSNFSLYASGKDSITIRDLTLRDARNGLRLVNSDRALIQRVRANTNGENGFLLETDVDSCYIQACYADTNASAGFYLGEADYCSIVSSQAVGNVGIGFVLTSGCDTTWLMHCVATRNNEGFKIDNSMGNRLTGCSALSQTGAGFVVVNAGSTYNVLEYNLAQSSGGQGFYDEDASLNQFLYNTVSGGGDAFHLGDWFLTAIGNTISSPTGYGVYLVNTKQCTVLANRITSGGNKGIYLDNADECRIDTNILVTTSGDGISLANGSDQNTFRWNATSGATGVGLHVHNSDSNLFWNNTVYSSTSDAVKAEAGADSNIFRGDTVMSSGGAGFVTGDGSYWNAFYGCSTASATGYGFYFDADSTYAFLSAAVSSGQSGFYLTTSSYSLLHGCTVTTSGNAGIYVNGGNYNTVRNSRSSLSSNDGFKVENADYNTIQDNYSESAALSAFAAVTGANNNLFLRNHAASAGGSGFYVSDNDNVFFGNRAVQALSYGFIVDGTSGTVMVGNQADSNNIAQVRFEAGVSGLTFTRNNLHPKPNSNNGCSSATNSLDISRNWWGTRDSATVEAGIGGTASGTSWIPYRLGAVDTALAADTVAPEAPDTVVAVNDGMESIIVTWHPVTADETADAYATGLTGYRVWRAFTTDTRLWELRGTVGAAVDRYVDSGLRHNTAYCYRVTAYDDKTPWLNESFYSDSIARDTTADRANILISEIAVGYTSGDGDSDFIELFIKDDRGRGAGVNLRGWRLYTQGAGGNRLLRKTFDTLTVRSGSFVTLFFATDTGVVSDDTSDIGDSRAKTYAQSSNDIMPSTQMIIELEAPGSGNVVDAVVYSDQSSLNATLQTRVQSLVDSGLWSPDNTAGSTAPNAYLGLKGNALRRDSLYVDNNTKADWSLDSQTPGNMPIQRYVLSSDSSTPYVGAAFNLTLWAVDGRGETIVNTRTQPLLTVSNGSIAPGRAAFVLDAGDFIHGTAGETVVAATLSGYDGSVTVTATANNKTGSITLTARAPLESFTLVPLMPVKRGAPFPLRIRANNALGAAAASYTGTMTLSASDYAITPSSITWTAADLGDTTIQATLDGVGIITVTATADGKTGSCTAVPSPDTTIRINEFFVNDANRPSSSADRDEFVELYNRGGPTAVGGYTLRLYRDDGAQSYTFPALTVPAGKFVVVHFNRTGVDDLNFNDTDAAAHLYATNSVPAALSDTEDYLPGSAGTDYGAIALFTSSTRDSTTIVDFVAYSCTGAAGVDPRIPDTNHAEPAGIWTRHKALYLPSSDPLGRAFYLNADGADSDHTGNWTLFSAANAYTFTEGASNVRTEPSGTPTLALTSSGLDTAAAGDTIHITLTAGSGGNASAVDVTNVTVTSTTDATGIVVTLRETGDNTLVFKGEAYVAWTPMESNDGMRIIAALPSDIITAQWVPNTSVTDTIVAAVGTASRLVCTAPASAIQEEPIEIEVVATDRAGNKTSSWTGTISVSATDSIAYPASFDLIAADNGETNPLITFGAAPGDVTVTLSSAGMTSCTAALTVLPRSGYLVNEVLANVGTIDWGGAGGASENADEWVELVNATDTPLNLAGLKLSHAGSANAISLAGELPARGWVTVIRGGSGTGASYHFDSTGAHLATNSNLSGAFSTQLPNGGGIVQLWSAADTLIAMLSYPSLADDVSYGRAPDGYLGRGSTFAKPSPGSTPAAGPDNLTNNNAVFVVHVPQETALIGEAFPVNVAVLDRNGETVTSFSNVAASVEARVNGTLSASTLTFTNGVASTTLSYSAGNTGESSGIYVYYGHGYGLYPGVDTVTIISGVTVSVETSRVAVTQAVADGVDSATVQVVVVTAGGSPISGATVSCTSSKGGSDIFNAASQVTNALGVCSFTVKSNSTTTSKIYVTVNGYTLNDSPNIYWLDPLETGVYTSFGTRIQLGSTLSDTGQFYLWPSWSPNGQVLAYVARVAATLDTLAVYAAYDDGISAGDVTAGDGQFSVMRLTGADHCIVPNSRPAFAHILDTNGARAASDADVDNKLDVIFSAYTGANRRNLFVVRGDGSDSTKTKAQLVALTDATVAASWTQPTTSLDTNAIYAVSQGGIYRIYGTGSTLWSPGAATQIFPNSINIGADNIAHQVVDIAMANKHVMAVTVINSQLGSASRNVRGEVLVVNSLDTAGHLAYSAVNGTKVKQVRRNDSTVCWNLSWDTGGRALAFTRDRNGIFNYTFQSFYHADPRKAYGGADFDVEVVYITDTQYAPSRPVSLLNNTGLNDNSASFSPGGVARVAVVSHDSHNSTVKFHVVNIDGVTNVNTDGGLLFENGRLTAVVDEGDLVSGSVKLQVQRPAGLPTNGTPESIALTGNARQFFPSGQTFADSITVILYYDAADLAAAGLTNGTADEYQLKVYWYNPTTTIWEDYHAVVDPTDQFGALGKLTFLTNHFSIYGVGKSPQLPHEALRETPALGSSFTTRRPTFGWSHRDPASRPQVGWQVQISADSSFASVLYDRNGAGADTTHAAQADLIASGDSVLYWRVRTAAVAGAWGQWSQGDSWFRITYRLPNAPTLLSPAADLETRAFPMVSWTHQDPESRAQTGIQIEVSSRKDFSVVEHGLAADTTVSTLTLPFQPATGTWYWRLRTSSTNGQGPWSDSRSIQIDRSPLAPAVTLSPDTIRHPNPAFAWTHNSPENLAQHEFFLELATDSSFATLHRSVRLETTAAAFTFRGENAVTLRGSRTIYWRLRTATADRILGVATQGSFTLVMTPPAAPTLAAPSNGTETTASTLVFSWTHADADGDPQNHAVVRFARDSAFASVVYEKTVQGVSSSATVAGLSGLYYWQAATADTYDQGSWSAARSFTVAAARLAAVPSAPAAAALVTTPQPSFAWQHRDPSGAAQAGALLEISTSPSFASTWKSLALSGAATTHTLSLADSLALLGETTVYWRVRTSILGTDYGPASAESSFTLRLAVPSTPSPTAPGESVATRGREVNFTWKHRSQNDSLPQVAYELRLGRDTHPLLASAVRTFSEATNGGVIAWLDGGRWYWIVRTANLNGWSDWSTVRVLSIDTRALAPLPIAPSHGSTVTTPRPTFRWRHNDPDGFAQQAARILVSTDSTFASPLVAKTVLGSADSATLGAGESIALTGNRTLYWGIQTASFGTDFGPAALDSTFEARLNAPLGPTLAPPADTSRQRSPSLGVTHVDGEGDPQVAVHVQVSSTIDFSALVLDLAVETSASTFTPATPLAGSRYWWRARTADAVGWGPWSASDDFFVDTSVQWVAVRILSASVIPAAETRVLELSLVSDTGASIGWTNQATVRLAGRTYPGSALTPTLSGASLAIRIDTPGRYAVAVSEATSTASDNLHVLAKPASVTGDTWVALAGRAGVGQRVDAADTRLTVIVGRPAGIDSSLALTLRVDGETALLSGLAPSSLDSGLAYFTPSGLALTAGRTLTASVTRGAEAVASAQALVFSAPGVAAVFQETTVGTGIRIELPAGGSETPVWFTIRRNLPADSYASATRGAGRRLLETSVIEITAEDMDGNRIEIFFKELTLGLPAAGGENLKVAFLRGGAWVELPTDLDQALGLAKAKTNHLSVWGLVVGGGRIDAVVPYPNPWRNGSGVTDPHNDAYGIKFNNLPAGPVRFRIFTVAGELVVDGTLDPSTLNQTAASNALKVIDVGGATGQVTRWNLRNQHNQHVASGLYLIRLDHSTGSITKRVAVIR